jgi:hypothetical protein
MKQLGLGSAHFAAGVLTTCLIGTGVLYGLESWKKFTFFQPIEIAEVNTVPEIPKVARRVLAPIDFSETIENMVIDTDSTPRSVSDSHLTVNGQIEMLSAEYNATTNEATRQKLKEQLSILTNNSL